MKEVKMIEKISVILLLVAFIVMFIAVMGIKAKADTTEYGVWLGNEQFTSEKLIINDKDYDVDGKGKATYDPDNDRIIFDDFNGVKSYYTNDDGYQCQIYVKNNLSEKREFKIGGNAVLESESEDGKSAGIYVEYNCDLEIFRYTKKIQI